MTDHMHDAYDREALPEMADIVNIHEESPDIREVRIARLKRKVAGLSLALAAVSVFAVIGFLG